MCSVFIPFIAPRSSLAWKNHIDVGAGVIDADYRGTVGVVLFNHSDKDFQSKTTLSHSYSQPLVKQGDRVAQLVLEKIATPEVVEVDNIEDTERGVGGFGSTNKV
jgi:dUTP pyrophosphatase